MFKLSLHLQLVILVLQLPKSYDFSMAEHVLRLSNYLDRVQDLLDVIQ